MAAAYKLKPGAVKGRQKSRIYILLDDVLNLGQPLHKRSGGRQALRGVVGERSSRLGRMNKRQIVGLTGQLCTRFGA